MAHRFENVAEVFPKKHVTPYMVLPAGGEPQWFATMHGLAEYVNKVSGPVWVDVGDGNAAERRELFSTLPHGVQVPASVVDTIVEPADGDAIELHSGVAQYVWGALSCAPMSQTTDKEAHSTNVARGEIELEHSQQRLPDSLGAGGGMVLCGFFVTKQIAITFHSAPFLGLSETVWRMMRHTASAASPTTRGAPGARPCYTSELLASLVSLTVDALLPNTTSFLHEVDTIDEMVLLIAPNDQDQPDLLRRIALLRRRIAALRAPLYTKERLLQDMLTPMMRACFVCADVDLVVPLYGDTLDKVLLAAQRMDEMRKVLNQGNLTYVSCVSMRMSQSSALLDYKMSLLGKMATFVLPFNLLMGILGFNQKIPFQSDEYDTLTPFWVIVAAMFVWFAVCLGPSIVRSYKGIKPRSILDHTMLESL